MQAALRVALDAAEDCGQLDPVADAALAAVALDLAAAMDAVPAAADAYGHARLARMTLEALRELRLTPLTRGGPGELELLLTAVARPDAAEPVAAAGPDPAAGPAGRNARRARVAPPPP